ncbi:MAG TPA: hypothetical protein DDX39_10050 [Bacteroidales bacterium]|nr:MAG: hypothetical protein A2W98_01325 [Bacteroidetes bacterium GWF2_33_38]OFY75178.1 MAG: hypothetical protein A2265_05185 [Bacteroidetes bacterium RIFOXYA12_FULL_33_9]OFY88972.1 MAG: hypothetical protein A2236_04265 [Bacteroidetes bacterium RIFOXYA2_FULL_33_7]HBF88972.1 hypothetical protein [Bacteroidales bacterium]
MIKFILTAIAIVSIGNIVSAQGAGNWYKNQAQESVANNRLSNSYDEYYQSANQSINYITSTSNDTVIELTTKVMMNVKSDTYIVILGITQIGDSIETCHQLINARINKFIKKLEKLNIKKEDIYIDFISQVPVFEYEVEKKLFSKSYNEIPKGFELKKNVHIKYTDNKIAEQLLIEAAKSEIYDIIKVDYIIDNVDAVYDTLRQVSINIMNKKVQEFKKLGIQFTSMYQTVSENINSTFPIERYSGYTEFNKASFGAMSKSSSVATISDSKSLYYNKLSYNSFDQIINPTVVEPSVQFSYTIKTRFVLKKL